MGLHGDARRKCTTDGVVGAIQRAVLADMTVGAIVGRKNAVVGLLDTGVARDVADAPLVDPREMKGMRLLGFARRSASGDRMEEKGMALVRVRVPALGLNGLVECALVRGGRVACARACRRWARSRFKLVIKEEVPGKRGRRVYVRAADLATALPGVRFEHLVGDDGSVRLPTAAALLLANNVGVVLPPHVEMEPVPAAAVVACEEAPAVDSALEKATAAVASVFAQPEYAERVLAVLRSASARAGPSASTRSHPSRRRRRGAGARAGRGWGGGGRQHRGSGNGAAAEGRAAAEAAEAADSKPEGPGHRFIL